MSIPMSSWQSPAKKDNPKDHPLRARRLVLDTVYETFPDEYHDINDVYVVWFCYILGGWKALVGYGDNGLYYEVTHDVAKNQTYVDVYAKRVQRVFKVGEAIRLGVSYET